MTPGGAGVAQRHPDPADPTAGSTVPADAAYALGVLHTDQRHEAEAARFAFQQSRQKQTVGAN
ncbi:hypothetical protein GCM10009549_38050 [Streptomyces thermoalcalitolerans]|uniref:Uncharacterized protein n=1 Tax=Streptomyces thermoalcalitolerans TaxID=65605 RepID=A0ABP3ZG23_9ACTN